MRKVYVMVAAIFSLLLNAGNGYGQCPLTASSGIYPFLDPNGLGEFNDFLCIDKDSVGTLGTYGYYSGDGYYVQVIAGTQVTFTTDSCTGNPVSLTVLDENNQPVAGAYAAPACPNTVSFTAPTTGLYLVAMYLNGNCTSFGTTVIGQVYAQITPGSIAPDCPIQANVANDTICGATVLTIDAPPTVDNSTDAYFTDPLDSFLLANFECSSPNNTLWYQWTAPADYDSVFVTMSADIGGGLVSWLSFFVANDPLDPCAGVTYIGCTSGATDSVGQDTATITLSSVVSGDVFYIMVDGYGGSTGPYQIGVSTVDVLDGINSTISARDFKFYPNPTSGDFFIEYAGNDGKNATITLTNPMGQIISNRNVFNLSKEKVSTQNLETGIYNVRVTTSAGSISKNIIVTK